MYLLVGLGNPGPKYASQRHNVGFMVIDRVAASCRADAFREKWKGEFVRTSLGGTDTVLLKPMTYMNLSGESVLGAMTFFKVPPSQVIVVHDEMDLAFGDVRLKVGGGIAGHNGLRSIVQHCGPDFVRLRIGIGRPAGMRAEDWVLGNFSKDEAAGLASVLDDAERAIALVFEKGVGPAMNQQNTRAGGKTA